jgi:hypothetical protein
LSGNVNECKPLMGGGPNESSRGAEGRAPWETDPAPPGGGFGGFGGFGGRDEQP